ncbi:MAG TPA: phosphoribosylglycinamide synthetase C domain-containing protein, partial [Patescibacteria group bacterium]|nr:phosphoribosylglycinamide synthetase C domain-containing protein [Patescibacteria group bacterium]
DGDTGPNTGGMGSYSDADHSLPFLEDQDIKDAAEMTKKVMHAVKEETGVDFKGIMYGGFMKTKNGVRLIEYNTRFGDPEAMNVLPLLETDFVDLCLGIINQDLKNTDISFKKMSTVCLYVVPEGYPGNVTEDPEERVIRVSKQELDAEIFYSSVDLVEETGAEFILRMSSSRALAFTGIAPTIQEALGKAKEGLDAVEGKVRYRTDIGTPELIQQRIDLINSF